MTNDLHLDLRVVEQRTCKIASEQLGIPLNKVLPTSRLIEDLHCDSLELVELIMVLESRNAKNGRRNHLQLRKFLQMNVRRSHLVNLAVVGN